MSYRARQLADERRRQQECEEEQAGRETIRLADDAHADDWEYKIVRATAPVFADPTVFRTLLAEEAQAGWQLLEKLDNTRVRFKRRQRERADDDDRDSPIDAYRTSFAYGEQRQELMIILIVMIVLVCCIFFLR